MHDTLLFSPPHLEVQQKKMFLHQFLNRTLKSRWFHASHPSLTLAHNAPTWAYQLAHLLPATLPPNTFKLHLLETPCTSLKGAPSTNLPYLMLTLAKDILVL